MGRPFSLGIVGSLLLFVLAVASYSSELPEYPMQPASAYANKVVDSGLIVAIEVVGDTEQQKKYFNSNLNSRGILPVLVVIQNTSAENAYLFDKSAVALGNTIEAIGKGALKAGALLGSGGLLDVTLLPPGQMRMALTRREIRSKTLSPGSTVSGFVYIPISIDAPRKSVHLQVPLTNAHSSEIEVINLVF
jgi:hypothetical protein